MERETCEECERNFIRAVNNQNIDEFLEKTFINEINHNICVKCFVRICNRYL